MGHCGPDQLRPGRHQEASGKSLEYFDQEKGEHYIPYVIEPSLGVERSVLAVLCDAYDEEVVGQDKNGKDDVRVVMHFHPALAPFKAAILPLSKKEVLSGPAMELYNELSKEFMVAMTRPAPSASAIAVRMRSALPSALPWTLRPWAMRTPPLTTVSPSVSVIP